MPRTFRVAMILTIDDPDHSPVKQAVFDSLVRRLKEEMARGRENVALRLPGVTAEMLASYREWPERN